MAEVDHIGRYAETGDEHPCSVVDQRADLGFEISGCGGEQVDTPRLVGQLLGGLHLDDHALNVHRGRPEGPETSGFGHGCHQLVVRDTTHTGQHDGVVNFEDVGQTS